MHVHEAVLTSDEHESGITIQYINEHYDQGDIIFQAKCPVLSDDTVETLAQRVHALEYTYYPQVIERLLIRRKWYSLRNCSNVSGCVRKTSQSRCGLYICNWRTFFCCRKVHAVVREEQ